MTEQERMAKCAALVKRIAWDWDIHATPTDPYFITKAEIQRQARLLAPLTTPTTKPSPTKD